METSLINYTEKLINHLLSLDETANAEIGKLAGKKIAIEINEIKKYIYINILPEGIFLSNESSNDVNVKIKASPINLFKMLLPGENETSVSVTNLEIAGDVGLAQQFQSILRNMEIDWEEYFSQWIGDYPAHKLGNIFQSLRNYAKTTRSSYAMDISEYLRFELEAVPLKEEVDRFNKNVDELRDDSERLQQRIKRLERNLN